VRKIKELLKHKKNLKTIYTFICPIFELKVKLFLGDNKKFEKTDDAAVYTMSNGITTEFIVWIKKEDELYHMIHETLHLTKRIFRYVGISFDMHNDELIAYYQNYWIRKFWDKMSKFVK